MVTDIMADYEPKDEGYKHLELTQPDQPHAPLVVKFKSPPLADEHGLPVHVSHDHLEPAFAELQRVVKKEPAKQVVLDLKGTQIPSRFIRKFITLGQEAIAAEKRVIVADPDGILGDSLVAMKSVVSYHAGKGPEEALKADAEEGDVPSTLRPMRPVVPPQR